VGAPLTPPSRVARFYLVHGTKTGKNVPNQHKMYQMVTYLISQMSLKYSKWQ
jgi:hypothetical protein